MGELSEAKRCWKAETIRANNLDVENAELKGRIREMEKEDERKQILLTEMTSLYDDVNAEIERLKEQIVILSEYDNKKQEVIDKLKKMLKGWCTDAEWCELCGAGVQHTHSEKV